MEHSVQCCSFSAFLGGYSLFLGTNAGIMMSDFWVLRKTWLSVAELRQIWQGWQERWDLSVPKGATYRYSLDWCIGIVVAFVVYTVLGNIWPIEEKFDEGQVMDVVDGSSISQSDREGVRVPEDGKAKDF